MHLLINTQLLVLTMHKVHEIELYLVGVQDDVGKRASMTLSQLSKFIVWPEVSDLKCIYFLSSDFS